MQIAPRVVPANFIADPINARQVAAGRYLAAVRALGSPAYPSYGELTTACARLPIAFLSRERCWRSAPTETFAGTRPLVVLRAHGRISADNLYWRLVPAAGEASMDVSVPAGGELLFRSYPGSGVSLYLRFAATFPAAFARTPGGATERIRFPADLAPGVRWVIGFTSAHTISVCVR